MDNEKQPNAREITRRIEYFTERIYFWQRKLGFTEVEMHIIKEDMINARASWYVDEDAMLITISYSIPWIKTNDLPDEEINKVAFHEVFESQFHKIDHHLRIYYSDNAVSQMLHEVTRKVENHIYPELV